MKVVIDIEANGLENPTQVWLIVCKDIDTDKLYIFRNLTTNEEERIRFEHFSKGVSLWIGHNLLGYDGPVLSRLIQVDCCCNPDICLDTLIVSKLVDYPRKGHSVEDYGLEFGIEKGNFHDWSKWSEEMEVYCIRDVDITHRIYLKYLKYINNPERKPSILTEHKFQLLINKLSENGFSFNSKKAQGLLDKVNKELEGLDGEINREFPPREVLIREFVPKATKFGTISKSSVPRLLHSRIQDYEIGKSYRHTKLVDFNPSSHKQIIQVLNEAGWSPVEKTATHIETERELNKLKYQKHRSEAVDLEISLLHNKLQELSRTGWKVNEANLETLPPEAPSSARSLAKRILLEARRRSLTEWLGLVNPDTNRIHGKFYGIGAWTHRMAHQKPNTANIPNEFDTAGQKKLLGKEMRSLWQAPRNRLLVGVDAEGIQLRIFAHYINDPEFTQALVDGKKEDKSDPHSLNQRILGDVCKSRAAAKRFIYALLLGAGIGKLTEILGCSPAEAEVALNRLLERYTGFAELKETIIPADAKRGWFVGLDGRAVRIPGDTSGSRKHLAMSGYLQNGEAVVMKLATLKWWSQLEADEEIKNWLLVNFVHDEWQTECPNNMEMAIKIAKIQANSLKEVGEDLKLKCPLAGSYFNDDIKDYTISTNWSYTH